MSSSLRQFRDRQWSSLKYAAHIVVTAHGDDEGAVVFEQIYDVAWWPTAGQHLARPPENPSRHRALCAERAECGPDPADPGGSLATIPAHDPGAIEAERRPRPSRATPSCWGWCLCSRCPTPPPCWRSRSSCLS